MKPHPHGIVKREALDGVREGPLPPGKVLVGRDDIPNLAKPPIGGAGEMLWFAASALFGVVLCLYLMGAMVFAALLVG